MEPFLRSSGGPPDTAAELFVHGPLGAAAIVLVSVSAGSAPLAKLEAPLWVPPDGNVLLPVVTTGQDAPITLSAHLPPGALPVGTTLRAQAAFPTVSSTLAPGHVLITNEAVIVVQP